MDSIGIISKTFPVIHVDAGRMFRLSKLKSGVPSLAPINIAPATNFRAIRHQINPRDVVQQFELPTSSTSIKSD